MRLSPQRRPVWAAGLLILLVSAAATARWHWQRQLDRAFPDALDALQRNDLRSVQDAIYALEGRRDRQSQLNLLRGALLMRQTAWNSALKHFSQIVPEGDVRAPALHMTGECLYWMGRLPEAESVLRKLAEEVPDNVHAHRWLAAIYYDIGANDASIAELQRVTQLDPRDYAPHRLIALMQMDFGQNQEAIEHFRAALSLSPPPHVRQEVLRDLAKCLIADRDYHAAIDALQQAEPDALALAHLSECYWSLGQHDEARQLLDQARGLDAEERSVLFLQARMQMSSGQPEEAVASLEQLLKHDPYDAEGRYQLALAFQRLGDEERHQAEMARWQELSDLYQRLTKLNIEAIQEPYNAALREQLAEVCTTLGKHEIAAMWKRVAEALRAGQDAQRGTIATSNEYETSPAD